MSRHGATRARIRQLMSLLRLAPEILVERLQNGIFSKQAWANPEHINDLSTWFNYRKRRVRTTLPHDDAVCSKALFIGVKAET